LCFIFEDFDANNNRVLKPRGDDELSDVLKLIKSDDKISVSASTAAAAIHSAATASTISCKDDDDLTLDCVLNILDGIIELHNAMIIFTTNHLEQIDPAFLRPGRIDFKLELTKMTTASMREMIKYKFQLENDDDSAYECYFDKFKDFKLTPAELQNICFRHTKTDIIDCLREITALFAGDPGKL
jgi:SpoVK/Ycf46/Vps4 family AAA+-type ATPase